MSTVNDYEDPVTPQDESSAATVREFVKNEGQHLTEQKKVTYLLNLVRTDAIIYFYQKYGKTFSQESIQTILKKTHRPLANDRALSYTHPYQIVSSTNINSENIELLLEYYIEHPNNETLMQSILNRQLDVSLKRLEQLSEHISAEVRITVALHYDITEQIVEKIWNEDESIRSGLIYSHKLPLRLVFEKIFGENSNATFRKNCWDKMKTIHSSRPEWKPQLAQIVQEYTDVEGIDDLPVEWLTQLVDLFIEGES